MKKLVSSELTLYAVFTKNCNELKKKISVQKVLFETGICKCYIVPKGELRKMANHFFGLGIKQYST